MADYIYFVQLDIPQELEEDFNRDLRRRAVPNLATVPNVRGCTRYRLESADEDCVARDTLLSTRHPRSGPYASNDGQAKLIFCAGEFVRALTSSAYRYLALESSEGLTA